MHPFLFLKCLLFSGLLAFSFKSCVPKHYDSPANYDFQSPSSIDIASDMKNFSGITFFHGNASMIYAVDENDGLVYCYYPGNKNLVKSTFEGTGTFEDIAIMDSSVYILGEKGDIYTFPFSQMGQPQLSQGKKFDDVLPAGTYEAMFADDSTRQIIVITKKRPKEGWVTRGYIFSVAQSGDLHRTGTFKISLQGIKRALGREDLDGFHPSAIAKNPKTKQWYVISNEERILAVLDKKWKVIGAYDLNPKIFPMPQGLVFDKDGNLYVANDGVNDKSPNIQMFLFKKMSTYAANLKHLENPY